jgi:hypothetical protein
MLLCMCVHVTVLQVQRGPPIKAKLRGMILSTFRSAISGTDFCTCSCKRYLLGMWWVIAVVSNHSPNMCLGYSGAPRTRLQNKRRKKENASNNVRTWWRRKRVVRTVRHYVDQQQQPKFGA